MEETKPTPEPTERREMSAEEFIKIWKGEYEGVEGYEEFYRRGLIIAEKFIETSSGNSCAQFDSIKVSEKIIFVPQQEVCDIILINSEIDSIQIKGVGTKTIVIDENSEIKGFEIKSTDVEKLIIDNKSSLINLIVVSSKLKSIYVSNDSTVESLVSRGGTFGEVIFKDSIVEHITFTDSFVQGILFQENAKSKGINIHYKSEIQHFHCSSSIIARIDVSLSKVEQMIIVGNSIIGKNYLSDSQIESFIFIKSKTFLFTAENIDNRHIEFGSSSYIGHLNCDFKANIFNKIHIHDSFIGKLNLRKILVPESVVCTISNCFINYLNIEDFCNNSKIFFNNIKPPKNWSKFKLDENEALIQNPETLEFVFQPNDKNDISLIRISDSDLGNSHFINCDLTKYERFEFHNTKMLDVFVAGSKMPRSAAFRLPKEDQPPYLVAEQKRLAYSQFKKIYENQGDRSGALCYLAFEMDAYWETLWMDVKKLEIFKRRWWDKLWDLIIVTLNKVSNNHGNNWVQGALMTILVSVICFSVYLNLLNYHCGSDWSKFWDIISYTPQYLNPFRDEDSAEFISKITEQEKIEITAGARIWDYFSRVIVAYFVYQTIQAFRKLGKSSG